MRPFMLQEFRREGHDSFSPRGPVGEGVGFLFHLHGRARAVSRVSIARIEAIRAAVGNSKWVIDVRIRRISLAIREPDRCRGGHQALRGRKLIGS